MAFGRRRNEPTGVPASRLAARVPKRPADADEQMARGFYAPRDPSPAPRGQGPRLRGAAHVERAEALARAVRLYVDERENPAPDFRYRHSLYDQMIEALQTFEGGRG